MPGPAITLTLTVDQQDAITWELARTGSVQTVEQYVQACCATALQPLVTAMLSADASQVQEAFLVAPAPKRQAVKSTLGV